MGKKTLKMIFPGLNIKEIEFSIKYIENPFKSFLALIIVLVWRGQIAYSQSLSARNNKELLCLPSMKYTSKLISSNPHIQSIIAAVAIFRTSADELKFSDFVSLSINQRNSFIVSKIFELRNSTGDAKILSSRQISSLEDLLVHRRGLLFQIKSIFQSSSIFDSGSIINGLNILYVGKFEIIQLISNFFHQEVSVSIDLLKGFYFNSSFAKNNSDPSIDELLNCFILEFLFEGSKSLVFQDGILVSEDEDNLLPIEKNLPIKRNKPRLLPNSIEFDPGNDLFLKAAFSQLNNIKKNYKFSKASSSKFNRMNSNFKN